MAPSVDKTPYTQIIYLNIPAEKDLIDPTVAAGHSWSRALDIIERQPGFIRLSWGRSPEDRTKVQLHTVRTDLSQHKNFLYSASYNQFLSLINPLLTPNSPAPFARHARLTHFTPPDRPSPLSPSTPFSGSAIYLATDVTWHEGAWPLWTHIVRHVSGCVGIAGGELLEEVDGHDRCYLVYVGWESIEKHEEYHHTEHFAKRRIVLGLGNKGYREYAHMKFEGERVAKVEVGKSAKL